MQDTPFHHPSNLTGTSVKTRLGQRYDHTMIWAVCTLCFFGFLRAGEVTCDGTFDPGTHLRFDDIAIDNPENPSVMQVHIKVSKTDPFRKGVDIYVGRTNNGLCPIAAMLVYLAVRGDKGGPLFQFEDGKFLNQDRFVVVVCAALSAAGLRKGDYAGHSFRIGAATTTAQCGIPDATIQMLGRWKTSPQYPRSSVQGNNPLSREDSQKVHTI